MKNRLIPTIGLLLLLSQLGMAQIPQKITYQGFLTDTAGAPIDGAQLLTFTLYDAASAGTALWTENQVTAVSKGMFNTILGSIATLDLPFDSPYWLGIKVGLDPEMTPRIELTATPYSLRADTAESVVQGAVPLGAVIDWWRPNADFPLPEGYQICDGSTVTDPTSPYVNFVLPDLSDKFVRGVSDTSLIGQINGTATHTHSVDPPSTGSSSYTHTHSVNPPNTGTTSDSHTHSVNPLARTSTTDTHNHIYTYFNTSENWWTYDVNGNSFAAVNWSDGMDAAGTGWYPMGIAGTFSTTQNYYTNNDFHSHSVDILATTSTTDSHTHSVNLPTTTSTTDAHSHSTDIGNFSSASSSSLPPYVGLLKLMRII